MAIAREDLSVTLVDSVAKKVGFLKHAIAQLGLAPRVRALHLTLRGVPEVEGLPTFDVAVSRAFSDPSRWAALARPYVRDGGTLVVMAGTTAHGARRSRMDGAVDGQVPAAAQRRRPHPAQRTGRRTASWLRPHGSRRRHPDPRTSTAAALTLTLT